MKKAISIILVIFVLYLSSYIIFRQTHIEIWQKNNQAYVIFPENKFLYYFYRPLTYADEKITQMNFHIGQH